MSGGSRLLLLKRRRRPRGVVLSDGFAAVGSGVVRGGATWKFTGKRRDRP